MGAGLGVTLYGCVRLRMHFGPIVLERYGKWARYFYWLLTIAVMVLIANLGLMLLRAILGPSEPGGNNVLPEIWFALLALSIALRLIFGQLKWDA